MMYSNKQRLVVRSCLRKRIADEPKARTVPMVHIINYAGMQLSVDQDPQSARVELGCRTLQDRGPAECQAHIAVHEQGLFNCGDEIVLPCSVGVRAMALSVRWGERRWTTMQE